MIAALAALLLGGAIAHPMAPSHVVIDLAQGTVVSTHERGVKAPVLSAPLGCTPVDGAAVVDGESIVVRLRWQCLAAPTGPVVLRPEVDAPPVIVEVHAIDGTQTIVLDAAHPVVDLSRPEAGALATLMRWTWIGAEHLWGGLDHLFLVLGLVLLIGVRMRLVAALTAFTLGHSLSLALGATGLVTLPAALVETAIAVTLVWLALDLVAPPKRSAIVAMPWLTGTLVGLVHGLGFAGVLGELGLPEGNTALALFGFNLGLELAQLAAVAVFAAALWALRKATLAAHVPRIAGWALGVLASAWVFERALG